MNRFNNKNIFCAANFATLILKIKQERFDIKLIKTYFKVGNNEPNTESDKSETSATFHSYPTPRTCDQANGFNSIRVQIVISTVKLVN